MAETHPVHNSLLVTQICLLISACHSVGMAQQVPTIASAQQSQEEWFRISFDDKPVGYERVTTRLENGAMPEESMLRRVRETRMSLRRFGRDLSVSAHLETLETRSGLLSRWSLRRTAADGSAIERLGELSTDGTAFDVSEKVQGTRRTLRLPIGTQPYSPMIGSWLPSLTSASDRRMQVVVFFPETSAAVEMQVQVREAQNVRGIDKITRQARRIQFWPVSDPEMRTTLFCDDRDQVIRSEQPLLGSQLILERTEAAIAVGSSNNESLDLDLSGIIPVNRQISNASNRLLTRLRILRNPGEQIVLPESAFQKIEQPQPHEIIVTLIRPTAGLLPNADQSTDLQTTQRVNSQTVDEAYRNPSSLVESTHPSIARLARISAGTSAEPDETCRRMTRYLAANVKHTPFSTSLVASSEVAATMRGDCTEHSILLAAMMRAAGIPSRVVVGLTYVEKTSAFVGHMWTEAFVNGTWMPYDSTRGPDGFGATSIRVFDSALADDTASGVLLFLPLLDFIGRAKIEILGDSGS